MKITKFFRGVKTEMGRVRWTSKKNLWKYSVATIVFIVFFGAFFYAIDFGIAWLRTL